MAGPDTSQSLEDRLRQMMLSNVRIGESPTHENHRNQHQYQQQAQQPSNNRHYARGQYQASRGASNAPRGAVPAGGGPQLSSGHNAFGNGPMHGPGRGQGRGRGRGDGRGRLWTPASPGQNMYQHSMRQAQMEEARARYLDAAAASEISRIQMPEDELLAKDAFRARLNAAFTTVQSEGTATLALQSFGSLKSGFATAGSDMDLVIVDVFEDSRSHEVSLTPEGLPRRFEKLLLDEGVGARLLTRARVPIIKVCESPSPELLQALRDARDVWDALPDDQKLEQQSDRKPDRKDEGKNPQEEGLRNEQAESEAAAANEIAEKAESQETSSFTTTGESPVTNETQATSGSNQVAEISDESQAPKDANNGSATTVETAEDSSQVHPKLDDKKADKPKKPPPRAWMREKKKGPLDFPKDGVGIQCDINFFNPLGLYNTHMLHCYSLCDPRVRDMILFVKAWARKRKINSPYSGTLSSYGYVLMVLHYLINIAHPPVLPNLQLEAIRLDIPPKTIDGWEVRFWGNEAHIKSVLASGGGSTNRASLGALLVGFYQYYATNYAGQGFVWMRDVLSLRTPGGILSKQEKGWTGAKTETTERNEVRHRYLFAVEDPFELTHNVARTVTHPGIVAIRDEFRRAWRIIGEVMFRREGAEDILDELREEDVLEEPKKDEDIEKAAVDTSAAQALAGVDTLRTSADTASKDGPGTE